jgi:hypothetical protein
LFFYERLKQTEKPFTTLRRHQVNENVSSQISGLLAQSIIMTGSFCLNISGAILTVQEDKSEWVPNLQEASLQPGN